LKSTQGADERLTKTLEQLHQLQGQNIDQANELKKVRTENTRINDEVRELHDHLRNLLAERLMVFSELDRINATCSELHNLVT
jgi:predicted nuclease with TOPRIM domain